MQKKLIVKGYYFIVGWEYADFLFERWESIKSTYNRKHNRQNQYSTKGSGKACYSDIDELWEYGDCGQCSWSGGDY
jgi:hypothetical protein